jgi:alkylhydroperoxidase/carboxymuconolactone decarboxylase family protein YurZ
MTQQRDDLPRTFQKFTERFPELRDAHQAIAQLADKAGSLSRRECELIKMGICMGAGLESAFRSHVRRAMEHGATIGEVEQAVVLAMTTVGFPRTAAAWQWAHKQIAHDRDGES